MIRHFLTLTWNKKKQHLLLIAELFFVYLVVAFLVFFTRVDASDGPASFSTDNVLEAKGSAIPHLKEQAPAIREIKAVSLSEYVPYSRLVSREAIITYQGQSRRAPYFYADEQLTSVLDIPVLSGRWFDAKDIGSARNPIIITDFCKNWLFGNGDAVNKTIQVDSIPHTVIGVVAFNDPSLDEKYGMQAIKLSDTTFGASSLLVKLKRPLTKDTFGKIKMALSNAKNEFTESITPLNRVKRDYEMTLFFPRLLFWGLGGFLVMSCILGLFSMLYQNISRRRQEIGLRRAAGATEGRIYSQIILEMVLLTSIALIPGIIVAFQFAIFHTLGGEPAQYYFSIATAIWLVYVMVIVCALYPARLAAKIQPAAALHED